MVKRADHGTWSRNKVREDLRALAAQGVRITPLTLKELGHADLLWASYRYFGNFIAARHAAGIPKPRDLRLGPAYTKAQAARVLRKRTNEAGGFVPVAKIDNALEEALTRHYGSIIKARRALKLPPQRPGRMLRWSRTTVIAELRELANKGVPLTTGKLTAIGRADLRNAIYRHVGSMAEAKRLVRRRDTDATPAESLSKSRLIAELRSLRDNGVPLTTRGLEDAGRDDVLKAVRKHYGGLKNAHKALSR